MAGESTQGRGRVTHGELKEETRKQIFEEVAKAFEATIPYFLEQVKIIIQQELSKEKAGPVTLVKEDESIKAKQVVQSEHKRASYKDFMICKPREFQGDIDPLGSLQWISEIETVFETIRCDEADKVIYATSLLGGRAEDWWGALKQEKGKEVVKSLTWDEFKVMFFQHFCPRSEIERWEKQKIEATSTPSKKNKFSSLSKKGGSRIEHSCCKICGSGHSGECRCNQVVDSGRGNTEIPMEIMTEILRRLPTKSLGQFRCVSKSWLALISEPQFIKDHLNTLKRTHLIYDPYDGSVYTLPFNQLDETPKFSLLLTHDKSFEFHGSCNGLVLGSAYVCLVDDFHVPYPLVILNPTTKEHIKLPIVGNEMLDNYESYTCGFGYDSLTDDYKVVTLSYSYNDESNYVYVYSLRNNTWRWVRDYPYHNSKGIGWSAVFVNGFLHWIVYKGTDHLRVIVAFSLAEETFSEVPLPNLRNDVDCKLFAVGEKLGIFLGDEVRVMNEYGVRESWSKIAIHGLKLCDLDGDLAGYDVHEYWEISMDGYCYNPPIVETKTFYVDGKIILAKEDRMWVYDVEGKSFRKTIDTSKDIEDLSFCGTYVESLVSPKF